jgi:hypothetical protein
MNEMLKEFDDIDLLQKEQENQSNQNFFNQASALKDSLAARRTPLAKEMQL